MFASYRTALLCSLMLVTPVFVWAGDEPASKPAVGDLGQVGDVRLETSCARAIQPDFARATALLHSFFYEEARRVFAGVAEKDPKCAMAQWGIAMTWWHPIWAAPAPEDMQAGTAAIEKAKAIGGRTGRERGYVAALDAFYAKPVTKAPAESGQSCHGPTGGGDHPARALAYAKAMEKLQTQYPEDIEIAAFHALALLGTASPADKTLKNQRQATEILEPLYAKHPNHPGIIHYLIHGYDYPQVAQKGLPAAEAYAKIAPRVPHALHMPSHIFTRLGMWDDVIQSNLDSADAASDYAHLRYPDARSFDELHALDYLVYGYLQRGQDDLANGVVEKMRAVRKTNPEVDFAVAYATGAVPARYALERRQWSEAARLVRPPSPSWEKYPFGAAHVAFARAFGAARAGQLDDARTARGELARIAASMTDPSQEYFAKQTQMQVRVVEGWLAVGEGRAAEAEMILREAADSDDALGKHPVSPGSLLPAREVLADFLAERGRHAEALSEYQRCLTLNPRRLNSLYGAGRAAERNDQRDIAAKYYNDLMAMVAADTPRTEIAAARAFLAVRQATAPSTY